MSHNSHAPRPTPQIGRARVCVRFDGETECEEPEADFNIANAMIPFFFPIALSILLGSLTYNMVAERERNLRQMQLMMGMQMST